MKLKLWQWEFDFDAEDATLVFPLILLLLGLFFTKLNREAMWGAGVAYYLLYFFFRPSFLALKGSFVRMRQRMLFRCPYCKSREVVMQGYQGFRGSDEQYAYHICNQCRETSIQVNDRLLKG